MVENKDFDKNYFHLLWSGVASSVSARLVSPSLVLPFLYLALGAPQAIAGLLLPFVTAARLVSEIFISPFLNRSERAIPSVVLTNTVSAVALSGIALFAADLVGGLVAALFVGIALILGLCAGISSIGISQVYGGAIDQPRRDRIFFVQAAISGIIVILILLGSRFLLSSDDPYERHIVMLWIGIGAILVASLSIYGTRILEEIEEGAQEPEPELQPRKKPRARPIAELLQGLEAGIKLDWFRRFIVARLFFLSVELAMPFYTIHASTYHLSNKHSLSTFVIAAAAGGSVGAIVWRALIRRSMIMTMVLGSFVAAASAILALTLDFMGLAQNLWVYAMVIFLLAFGCGGVINGRYLYLITMTAKSERPYLVALGDVAAGLVGIVFAAGLGMLAHWQDERAPLLILSVLNVGAIACALWLVRPKTTPEVEAHIHRSPDHRTAPG